MGLKKENFQLKPQTSKCISTYTYFFAFKDVYQQQQVFETISETVQSLVIHL